MSTKHGFMLASVSLIQRAELITSKLVSLLFPKVWRNCVISLQNTIVLKFVWNLPASIGSLYLIFWKKQIFLLFLLIPNIRNYKKETRLTERMRNEFVIYSCVKWLNLPLFHLLKFAIEFQETSDRYKRIKSHRGHKKAIIAICRMLLTVIWHILSDLKPYSAEGFLELRPVNESQKYWPLHRLLIY